MESQSAPGGLREELRSDAGTITDTAKQRIHSELDSRKGGAATQAKSLSSALESAAGELNDSPQWLRSVFQQGAQTLQRFADSVEQKDSRELTRDVEQLARQNPGTFLATCALAGFAAARVFKAGTGGTNASNASGMSAYDPYSSDDAMSQAAMPLGGIDQQSLGETRAYGDVA